MPGKITVDFECARIVLYWFEQLTHFWRLRIGLQAIIHTVLVKRERGEPVSQSQHADCGFRSNRVMQLESGND
jgi:hypothetical protein